MPDNANRRKLTPVVLYIEMTSILFIHFLTCPIMQIYYRAVSGCQQYLYRPPLLTQPPSVTPPPPLPLDPYCTPIVPLLYPHCTPRVPHLYPHCTLCTTTTNNTTSTTTTTTPPPHHHHHTSTTTTPPPPHFHARQANTGKCSTFRFVYWWPTISSTREDTSKLVR